MDSWEVLKIIWVSLAISATVFVMIWSARARGLFTWRKRIMAELNALEENALQTEGPQSCSLQVVARRCRSILEDISPEVTELQYLPAYIQSIAGCYHPADEHPELQATVGALINSLAASLDRLDYILHRPGFKKIRTLNVSQIKTTRLWYRRLAASPALRWWRHHRQTIQRVSTFRLFLYTDPLMLLAYASNRLTILILLKYLLADLYLFLGKVVVDAFENSPISNVEYETSEAELQATLEELNSAGESIQNNEYSSDPQIAVIRRQLVGFNALLTATPTPKTWWAAAIEAAELIAKKYFPDAPKPIEEARLGPLLDQIRLWIDTLSRGDQYLITRQLYRLKLETVYRAKDFPTRIPSSIKSIIGKSYFAYGWLKWPMWVYRWAKRRSPLTVAVTIGWHAAKKASLAYLYGRAFDQACLGLESVYRESRHRLRNQGIPGKEI